MFEFFNRIPPLWRGPLRFGLIGGTLGAVLLAALYYIGIHPFQISILFDFRLVLFAAFIFFTLKELRDYYFGGLLYFWQGMAGSLTFVVIYAVLASSLIWLFGVLEPRFITQYVDFFLAHLRSYPPEEIERIGKGTFEDSLATLPLTTPFDLARIYFRQCLMIGLFISIILSVILRRQPNL